MLVALDFEIIDTTVLKYVIWIYRIQYFIVSMFKQSFDFFYNSTQAFHKNYHIYDNCGIPDPLTLRETASTFYTQLFVCPNGFQGIVQRILPHYPRMSSLKMYHYSGFHNPDCCFPKCTIFSMTLPFDIGIQGYGLFGDMEFVVMTFGVIECGIMGWICWKN